MNSGYDFYDVLVYNDQVLCVECLPRRTKWCCSLVEDEDYQPIRQYHEWPAPGAKCVECGWCHDYMRLVGEMPDEDEE